MALSGNPRIYPVYMDGQATNVISGLEASGQTYKSHQFISLVAGLVTAVASDGAAIAGLASADASGTTSKVAEYQEITVDTVIDIAYTGGVPVLETAYGLVVSSNICKLDYAETTTDFFIPIKILREDSTTTGRCLVRVVPAKVQGHIGV